MLIQCTSKGCYSQDHHLLDATSNEVTCNTCGQVIDVPQTTKKALQSMSQIRRTPKSGVQVKCKACGHTGKPLLKSLSGGVSIAACRKCGKQLDVHPSFILAMKEMGGEYASDKAEDGND
jgi:Fe2+ or Zn2+ uptake regulation protein